MATKVTSIVTTEYMSDYWLLYNSYTDCKSNIIVTTSTDLD